MKHTKMMAQEVALQLTYSINNFMSACLLSSLLPQQIALACQRGCKGASMSLQLQVMFSGNTASYIVA